MNKQELTELEHAFLSARKDVARLEKLYKKTKDFKTYRKLQTSKSLLSDLTIRLNNIYDEALKDI